MHAASNSITLFNAVDQRYPLLDNARKNAACSRGEVAAGFEARVSRSARQTRWKLKVSRAVLAGAIKSSLDDLSRVIARSCGETAREREFTCGYRVSRAAREASCYSRGNADRSLGSLAIGRQLRKGGEACRNSSDAAAFISREPEARSATAKFAGAVPVDAGSKESAGGNDAGERR